MTPWVARRYPYEVWFRIFGYGLLIIDTRKRVDRPLFSERNNLGLWKYAVVVGPYKIKLLTP